MAVDLHAATTEAAEKLKCLQTDIDSHVKRYAVECVKHKNRALMLKVTSVCLAATITSLLGVKFNESHTDLRNALSNIALVLGGLITVLSAYEAFFDPRALWVRETVIFARLKDLQRDLRYWASGIDSNDLKLETLELFKGRLDRILEDSLKYWMKIRGAHDIEKIAEGALPRARQEVAEQNQQKEP